MLFTKSPTLPDPLLYSPAFAALSFVLITVRGKEHKRLSAEVGDKRSFNLPFGTMVRAPLLTVVRFMPLTC